MNLSILFTLLSVVMVFTYSRPLMDDDATTQEEEDLLKSFSNAISQFNPAAVFHQVVSFFDSLFESIQWPWSSIDIKTPRLDQGVNSGGEGEWLEEPSFEFSGVWWNSNDNSPTHSHEMDQVSYSSDSDSA